MTEQLRCPGCGKLLVVQLASREVRVVCPACGSPMPLPQAGASLQPTSAVPSSVQSAGSRTAPPRAVPIAATRPRFPFAATVIASGVALLLIGGLVATVLHQRRAARPAPAPTQTAGLPREVVLAAAPADPRSLGAPAPAPERSLPIPSVVEPQPRIAATQPALPDDDQSDFVVSPLPSPATHPATAPSRSAQAAPHPTTLPAWVAARPPGISDAQIGQAIRRGVDDLLANFQEGEISVDNDLVDSQKQALDALCVYALVQSSRAISDDRLSMHGKLLPQLIERLKSYEMVGDGKTTNRPITYGRSLRAAALATYARPQDVAVLKSDVAWLIGAQINGAYTYDDLYRQLMAQGEVPADIPPDRIIAARDDVPAQPPDTAGDTRMPPARDTVAAAQGDDAFPGGSPAPQIEPGPYDPPTSAPPYIPRPYIEGPGSAPPNVPGRRGGGGGQVPAEVPPSYGGVAPPARPWLPIRFPRPVASFPRPVANFPRPVANFPRPPGTVSSRGGKPAGTTSVPGGGWVGPVHPNDNAIPHIPVTFDYPWDNSNSQYGLLGVWAGAEVGMEVPDAYWKVVEAHWLACELRTGEWAYRKNEVHGYFAMTCAGVASLLVTHDYLDTPALRGAVGRPPYSRGLAAGLAWLEQGDHSVAIPNAHTHYMGYDLFGIERVGLASGYKYFGSHDWYREISNRIVPMQWPNGAWGHEDHGVESIVDTAYTLLFLSRGRHPVIMTKLKFDTYWDNRPRDVANLARWAGRELERPLNWQVVGIEHPWYNWFDSPVLYVASHQAPKLTEADYQKLKNFVQAGGLIFTHADGGSVAFNRWVPTLVQKIAPGAQLKRLPDNSPIYSIQYKLGSHPILEGVGNGARLLLVHSPGDLANAWQQRSDKTLRDHFQLGTNVFLYASGKPDLRNRLDSPYLPAPPAAPTRRVPVARVQYPGNWDPEPAAWHRFSRVLQWETGEAADPRPTPAKDLPACGAPLAALTGTDAVRFTAGESDAMRQYVETGGVLLIDACGGENAFTQSVRQSLLRGAFAGAQKVDLPADHPLYRDLKPGLANASPLRLRPYAIDRLGQLAPGIELLKLGKGYVVFSALDLTSGLLGTNTWGIVGYEPASCETFVRNLVLWTQDRDQ